MEKSNSSAESRCDWCSRTKAQGCLCLSTRITEADRKEMAETKAIAQRITVESRALRELPEDYILVTCTNCGQEEPQYKEDKSLGGLCSACYTDKYKREKCSPCSGCAQLLDPRGLSPENLCIICQDKKNVADRSTMVESVPPAELHTIVKAVNTDGDEFALQGYKASEIVPRPLEWIWQDKFPAGKVIILTGKPDCGKTTALMDFIGRITTGRDWPDGSKNTSEPQRVLLASSEDDPEDTLIPRLMAAGADLNLVDIIDGVSMEEALKDQYGKLVKMKKKERKAFLLTLHVKLIKVALKKHPDIRLIALDPMTAYLGADANRDKDIRPVMDALKDAVGGTQTSIIGIVHSNKRSDVDAMQKVSGASTMAGAPRAVWGFGRDPEDKTMCYMALVKANVAEKRTGMRYRLVKWQQDSPQGLLTASSIQWEGELEEDANEMLNIERDKNKEGGQGSSGRMEMTRAILRSTLAKGPVRSVEVYGITEKEGINGKMVLRALDDLGGKSVQLHGQRGWWMTLDPVKEGEIPNADEVL
jgi:putative DNA primase/helicase